MLFAKTLNNNINHINNINCHPKHTSFKLDDLKAFDSNVDRSTPFLKNTETMD